MSQPAEEQLMTPEVMSAAAIAAPSTAFMEFEAAYTANGSDACYCMVEGYDAPYYRPRVTPYFHKSYFVNCGNKKNVIALYYNLLNRPAYQTVQKLWFVDRDYDDNSTLGSDFCVTEGYSVENYYGGREFIDNFLETQRHLRYAEDQVRMEAVRADYNQFESDFISATRRFCAWYAVASPRATYKVEKLKEYNYKNRFPEPFATISKDGIGDKGYTLAELNTRYPLTADVSLGEYETRLSIIDDIMEIRGKFVLKFMIAYLDRLSRDGKKLGFFTKEFQLPSNDKDFMYYHSASAITTPSLVTYLQTRSQTPTP